MNLRERVGQLFMLGIQGTESSKDLQALFKSYHPGSIILFSRNLTDAEQAAGEAPARPKAASAEEQRGWL